MAAIFRVNVVKLWFDSRINSAKLRTICTINGKSHCLKLTFPKNVYTLGSSAFYSTAPPDSSETASVSTFKIMDIPDPPAPPTHDELCIVNDQGELAFAALNLGGWSPVGMAQSMLEFFHVSMGLPWWGSICFGTVLMRLIVTPLVIKSQDNAGKMSKVMPEIVKVQKEISLAKKRGMEFEVAAKSAELGVLMKENDIRPIRNVLTQAVQIPIFLSFFFGLRGMTNLPVESLKTGGIYWFTDLTIPDQYFILPALTSFTLLCTFEIASANQQPSASITQRRIAKYFLRILPIVMFPFILRFPSSILCYWASTNAFSLIQTIILRIPAVRRWLKLSELVKHDPSKIGDKSAGFIAEMKEAFNNAKLTKKINDLENAKKFQFKSAGMGPIIRTYKYDPTKQASSN